LSVEIGAVLDASAGFVTEGFAECEPEKPVACAALGCSLTGELTVGLAGEFTGALVGLISIMKSTFQVDGRHLPSKGHGD
jgi:hypothetical protein